MLSRLCEAVVERLPLGTLGRLAGVSLVAPCYHVVSDRPLAHVRHLYPNRSVREFEAELDFLLGRFPPVALGEVVAALGGGRPLPRRAFLLSFDDGFREMAEVVGPICRRKGVPVTFFLTTGFLDNQRLGFRHWASLLLERCGALGEERALARLREAWARHGLDAMTVRETRAALLGLSHRHLPLLEECARVLEVDVAGYLREARPYLTSAECEALVQQGFTLGGHSVDHPRYSELSLAEQVTQTRDCMAFLRARFPQAAQAFALPFVSDGVPPAFYQVVFEQRLAEVVFCIGARPAAEPRCVGRFGVERATNERLEILLRSELARQVKARVRSRWRG